MVSGAELFGKYAFGYEVWNQDPQKSFYQKEEEAKPANTPNPFFKALIHTVNIVNSAALAHRYVPPGDFRNKPG
ncbi:hypothetical protein GCM10027577_43480 [Spirosoma fluminis]